MLSEANGFTMVIYSLLTIFRGKTLVQTFYLAKFQIRTLISVVLKRSFCEILNSFFSKVEVNEKSQKNSKKYHCNFDFKCKFKIISSADCLIYQILIGFI